MGDPSNPTGPSGEAPKGPPASEMREEVAKHAPGKRDEVADAMVANASHPGLAHVTINQAQADGLLDRLVADPKVSLAILQYGLVGVVVLWLAAAASTWLPPVRLFGLDFGRVPETSCAEHEQRLAEVERQIQSLEEGERRAAVRCDPRSVDVSVSSGHVVFPRRVTEGLLVRVTLDALAAPQVRPIAVLLHLEDKGAIDPITLRVSPGEPMAVWDRGWHRVTGEGLRVRAGHLTSDDEAGPCLGRRDWAFGPLADQKVLADFGTENVRLTVEWMCPPAGDA